MRTNPASLLGLAWLLVLRAWAQEPDADLQELAGRSSEFGAGMYRKLAGSSDDNLVLTPLAVTLGLASLAAGAGGATRAELLQTLGLAPLERDGEPDRVAQLLQKLRETLGWNQAVGLYLGQEADSAFAGQVKTQYDVDVQSVDFSKAEMTKSSINDYVKSRTGSKVREVVSVLDPHSQMMLIGAAFVQGQWKIPFNASFTSEERFYVSKYKIIQVPMMFSSDKYYLAYDPTLKVGILKLPYTDGTAMLVLLPDEDVDHTSIDEAINSEVFLGWVKRLKRTRLEVQLPRFSLDRSYSLKQSLTSLGIRDAFQNTADLSGLSKAAGLSLSEVLYKTSVEVDETGGSGTAGPGNSDATLSLPPRLTINRPFIFLIYHEATKTLLHMGRVVNPAQK